MDITAVAPAEIAAGSRGPGPYTRRESLPRADHGARGKACEAGRNAAAGRSAPCPCGRGKQFKRCHGLGARPAPRKLIPESVGTDLRIHRAPDGQEIVITLLAGV